MDKNSQPYKPRPLTWNEYIEFTNMKSERQQLHSEIDKLTERNCELYARYKTVKDEFELFKQFSEVKGGKFLAHLTAEETAIFKDIMHKASSRGYERKRNLERKGQK